MALTPIFFIICFFYNLLFVKYLNDSPFPIYFNDIWTLQFGIHRIFGDTLLPIIFITYALYLLPSNNHKKITFYYLLLLLLLFMFSGGRGSLIAFYSSLFFGYITHKTLRKTILNLILFSIIGFVLSSFLTYIINEPAQDVFRTDSSGRNLIIKESITLIKNNLLLGIGPANFVYAPLGVSHPHNLFLQILIEWGIFSFIIAMIILISISTSFLKHYLAEQNPTYLFLSLSFVAFFINCNFNGAHIYASTHIYSLFIISYLTSLYLTKEPKSQINSNSITTITLSIITVISLITTSYLALNCANLENSTKLNLHGPRFWLSDSPHDDSLCK